MVYKIDNRPKKHHARYTILGIVLGIGITLGGIYLYDNNKPVILDNANQIKNIVEKQIPKDNSITQETNDNSEFIKTQVQVFINQQRTQYGLNSLIWNEQIARIAELHSNDMLQNDYFDHVDLVGKTPSDRLQSLTNCNHPRENIGSTTGFYTEQIARKIIDDWMNSPGHRANILSSSTSGGVGIAYDGNKAEITVDFC